MPGFADNLRRVLESANLSSDELASRLGGAPLWLTHLEAIDAALPELPQLVKLAEALGCPVDDLLAGHDEEYDHPRRRHAALLAARLGRARVLMERVATARGRRQITPVDERVIDEPALLATVDRCRAWVTSADAPMGQAVDIEAALDAHVSRIEQAVDWAIARWEGGTVPVRRMAPRTPPAAVQPKAAAVATAPAAVAVAAPAVPLPPAPKRPPRPAGHQTTMWHRPAAGDDLACEMYTRTQEVEMRLVHGDRALDSRVCRTLDEALTLSSKWKRLPDEEVTALSQAARG